MAEVKKVNFFFVIFELIPNHIFFLSSVLANVHIALLLAEMIFLECACDIIRATRNDVLSQLFIPLIV